MANSQLNMHETYKDRLHCSYFYVFFWLDNDQGKTSVQSTEPRKGSKCEKIYCSLCESSFFRYHEIKSIEIIIWNQSIDIYWRDMMTQEKKETISFQTFQIINFFSSYPNNRELRIRIYHNITKYNSNNVNV